MFRELLLKFHDRTGRWPKVRSLSFFSRSSSSFPSVSWADLPSPSFSISLQSIIVFRDGLSEGEYARANEREVHAIKSEVLIADVTLDATALI